MIQKNCVGRVSFTTDMWSDPDLKPYMAVTAHWLEQVKVFVLFFLFFVFF